jgi:hypothetical protein
MDLRETGCESVDGIYLTRDGTLWQVVMNMVMNLLGPLKKGRELLDQMGDCQRLKKGSAPWNCFIFSRIMHLELDAHSCMYVRCILATQIKCSLWSGILF